MDQLSTRGRSSITDYKTGIPDIFDNVYDANTNPSGIISLALSENHLIHGTLTEYINTNFHITEDLATTYTGTTLGGPRFRSAMAAHLNRYFSPHTLITTNEVLIANGVSAICSMLALLVGDSGDGVLLMRPIYGKFENDWGIAAKMQCLYTSFGAIDPFSEASVECYAQRMREAEKAGVKVRALLISNPHNPSGLCYPRSTLLALMAFCGTHNIHLISDEIYALSIFEPPSSSSSSSSSSSLLPPSPSSSLSSSATLHRPPHPFTSILSIPPSEILRSPFYSPPPPNQASSTSSSSTTTTPHPSEPDLASLFHAEYGLAKDFGAAGLHIGALVTQNRALAAAFQAIGLLHAPSGASCAIGAALLEDVAFVEKIMDESRRMLGENYAAVTRELEGAGIPYWRGGNAGYFLWIDLSKGLGEGGEDEERERALAERLLRGGVWLNAGQERGEEPGWFRLIFSHDKEKVLEGVRRIIKTLQSGEIDDLSVRLRKEGK